MNILEGPTSKVRLLALHGSGSNRDVTKMQLENLGVSEPEYDVVYANGPVSVDKSGPGIAEIEGLISGPWYSWLPQVMGEGELERDIMLNGICVAVQRVLEIIADEGPFDGVFGFSQGGVIASLVNDLFQDKALLTALKDRMDETTLLALPDAAPFRAAVIACAAAPISLSQLREKVGLGPSPIPNSKFQSVHLIGRKDNFKSWSESFALDLNSTNISVLYLDNGHEINQLQRGNAEVISQVRDCFSGAQTSFEELPAAPKALEWRKSSDLSSRSIASDAQIAAVKVKMEGIPDTIIGMLAAQPANAPLFRLAREQNADVLTTYGQMLSFCQSEGDLRRLGVQAGEVVAYLAPPGGGAAAAAAFLSIASQTCAVPLSSSMSETDALLAFEQYGVKHIVMFEGVSASGVQAACANYTDGGGIRIHYAVQVDEPSPGLFKYLDSMDEFQNQPVLVNPPSAYSLLLRTSGTTSTPKIVPLRQRDLVFNGAILADGIGINASDVTYSVMPLDHIGGLSASILCSIAVGASVTCDGLYSPQEMVEALINSNPRPTWYSAVPTIHNATVRYLKENSEIYLNSHGQWGGHNLRLIRSGAAALKEPDRRVLETTYGCEVVATYSMSEQMPISQPPRRGNMWYQQPGSVGVPVSASMAVVDPVTLRPLPFGVEGEIAISGPTVFTGYLGNGDANQQSRFLLRSHQDGQLQSWFLTGDLGEMDTYGGLSLRGRIKELIKRGGEQIAPAEIENLLTQHSWVNTAVCFSIPSDIYGEEVGCALVLESSYSDMASHQEVMREMRGLLREKGLAPYKVPTFWKVVAQEELPKTASKKYIRKGLSEVLGVASRSSVEPSPTPEIQDSQSPVVTIGFGHDPSTTAMDHHDKPKVDWSTLAGFRFLLACYVMFMHIGSNESWDAVSNLRQFPWHVHTFFALAGFSLVVFMPSLITRKFSFISARITVMYPLYALAVMIGLAHLLMSCQPSTFSSVFNWSLQAGNIDHMFCEGTPLVQDSWIANVLLTVGIHLTGLQATPLWGASWFLGFYLWFISMYFQCVVVFPFLYNMLYKNRGQTKRLLLLTVLGLGVNLVIVLSFWYGYAIDATGYGHIDPLTGLQAIPTDAQTEMASKDNAVILGFYLFAPFWIVYFVAGMCAAFLYDAIRPSEQRRAHIWGYVADAITVFMLAVSVAHVAQGYIPYGVSVAETSLESFFMRPEAADTYADPATVNRIWDNIYARLFAPITLLWIFALSTGQGLTARVLRFNTISQTLAPTAYACFLFHQMVGQWYYAATRNGEWWNWWSDQKSFYWFSPQPVPVEWYEYFYVVGLVVLFAKVVQPIDPLLRRGFTFTVSLMKGKNDTRSLAKDTTTEVLLIVERMTGIEVKPEWNLAECGLASLGIVQLTNTLETKFSTPAHKIRLPVPAIIAADNIREIASIVDAAVSEEEPQPSTGSEVLQTS